MNVTGGTQSQRWAAAGPGGGDVAYRMQTLTYKPIEISLDESVSAWTLLWLWLRAFIVSILVLVVFFVLWLLSFVLSDAADAVWSSGEVPGGALLTIGYLLSVAAFWVVLLASRIDEPIAEWKTLLEDKAQGATSSYAAIYGSLVRRHIPLHANAMRIRSDVLAPEIVNNRLVIAERSYTAYVSVFPYGSGLYVGWMMWRSRRGVTLIGHFVKDLIGSILGRTGSINQMLRTERIRAMREAVHSAVREGVEVAVQGVEVPLAATFGQDVPIQDLRVAAGMPAGGWAPAPVPAAPAPRHGDGGESGWTEPQRPGPSAGV